MKIETRRVHIKYQGLVNHDCITFVIVRVYTLPVLRFMRVEGGDEEGWVRANGPSHVSAEVLVMLHSLH